MAVAEAPRQLELLPLRRQTAQQRKELIRRRLRGLAYRQAERAERRRRERERRLERRRPDDRQRSIAELLDI